MLTVALTVLFVLVALSVVFSVIMQLLWEYEDNGDGERAAPPYG